MCFELNIIKPILLSATGILPYAFLHLQKLEFDNIPPVTQKSVLLTYKSYHWTAFIL